MEREKLNKIIKKKMEKEEKRNKVKKKRNDIKFNKHSFIAQPR